MTAVMDGAERAPKRWRRVTRHPAFMEYRRLAALVALANIALVFVGHELGWWFWQGAFQLEALSNAAIANFALGILIRQQRVVNALFWLATRIPVTAPLWVRWGAAKVFHFGGLHSGGTVAGTLWFAALLVGMVANRSIGVGTTSDATFAVTAVMVWMMVMIIITALGPLRAAEHNRFEKIHRFVGWSLLGLFWVQAMLVAVDNGTRLSDAPAVWVLLLLTLSIASPWMSLKRVRVSVEKPSDHVAIARFNYGDTPFPGSSNAISLTPFGEYHSFANIPTPGQSGYRLAISRAGDWTGRFIDETPERVWVKGITTSGVARIETLFRRVVYVGTGSGIGPILPHLFAGEVPNSLIWSTRDARKTYGDALVDEIESHTEDPLIWNTDERGKPNLTALALQAVERTGAEAVIVISNQKLTRRVVHDVESHGIPAFGAIWDS